MILFIELIERRVPRLIPRLILLTTLDVRLFLFLSFENFYKIFFYDNLNRSFFAHFS